MYEFDFYTSLRKGTVHVYCRYEYTGGTMINLRDYDLYIISVEWGFSGDYDVDYNEGEKGLLLDKAYDELELIKSNEDYF